MTDKLLDFQQIVSGTAILLSFFVGYKYGIRNATNKETPSREVGKSSVTAEDTSASSRPEGFFASDFADYKMVLVVRNDLKMGKGKIAAQCGHGAVGAYQTAMRRTPRIVRQWEQSGCAKIAVKVESKKQLLEIRDRANVANLTTCLIRDAGRTQIEPNSITVLAIGPARTTDFDNITGHLKLL